jgi:hypothetical protein
LILLQRAGGLWLPEGKNSSKKPSNQPCDLAPLNPFSACPTKVNKGREHVMRFGLGTAVLAIISSIAGAPAFAAVCMDKSMTQDEIIAAINAAPGCDQAMKIFEDCEYGASGDVLLGAAVEKKCEADFMPRLAATKKTTYQHEMGVCDRKYANEDGTMYRSFTAFCRAEIAQRYSRQQRKAPR